MLTSVLLKLTLVGAEWVLWLLIAMSFLSVSLVIERCLYFFSRRVDGPKLAALLQTHLSAGDARAALEHVSESDAVECRVTAAGLQALHRGHTACSEVMQSAKAQLKTLLDSRLTLIATIGSNAPFVGLLGTVLGIVKAAHDLTGGGKGQGDPNAVMAGVFEALVATAVGLIVAIPAIIAYNLLQRQVKKIMAQVDSLTHLVLSFAKEESKRSSSELSKPSLVSKVS